MSLIRKQRKDATELRRPDLKGHFICASCGQEFQHSASLNRHRQVKHSAEIHCMLCDKKLEQGETVRDHMHLQHNLQSAVYTCGCCNWTFGVKKLLIEHTKSIIEMGTPGESIPIAKSDYEPGSLLQSTIQGTQKVVKVAKRRIQKTSSMSPSSSSTSSSSTSSSRQSPNPEEDQIPEVKAEEKDILMNDAVDVILQSKFYTDEQLTHLDTWQKIVDDAKALVETWKVENQRKIMIGK